jgi:acetaldehyde dehydrogenase (acetylating)
MTLGPGAWGGSSTSDNITPLHLINIKRLGAEIRRYEDPLRKGASSAALTGPVSSSRASSTLRFDANLPGSEVQRIVDDFLRDFRGSQR